MISVVNLWSLWETSGGELICTTSPVDLWYLVRTLKICFLSLKGNQEVVFSGGKSSWELRIVASQALVSSPGVGLSLLKSFAFGLLRLSLKKIIILMIREMVPSALMRDLEFIIT